MLLRTRAQFEKVSFILTFAIYLLETSLHERVQLILILSQLHLMQVSLTPVNDIIKVVFVLSVLIRFLYLLLSSSNFCS